jgi:hypothetical protein
VHAAQKVAGGFERIARSFGLVGAAHSHTSGPWWVALQAELTQLPHFELQSDCFAS